MLKNIVVKVAIVVISLLIVKPVAASDNKTIKDDGKIFNPLCWAFGCERPIDPIEPIIQRTGRSN